MEEEEEEEEECQSIKNLMKAHVLFNVECAL
jgi:hypothetical protein